MITLEEMAKKQISNSELISIIVPVYKVEKYLNKCVKSIVNQTYRNLEIILVDDGSPDSCPKICEYWANKDNRIKVIHQKNLGLSAARNSGISIANGEYICFVDSDDYIDDKYIEQLYKAIKKEYADLAVCNVIKIDENGKIISNSNKNIRDKTYSGMQMLDTVLNGCSFVYVVAWNKLYKKELFNNLKYAEGKINEDEFIIHRLLAKCNKIVCINQSLYYYIQRGDSIMGTEFNIRRMDYLEALIDRLSLCREIKNHRMVLKAKLQLLYNIAFMKYNLDKANNISICDKIRFNHMFTQYYKSYAYETLISSKFSNMWLHTFIYNISPSLSKIFIKLNNLRHRF